MTRTWILRASAIALVGAPLAAACSSPADDGEDAAQTTQALPKGPIGDPIDPVDPPPRPPPRDAGTHVVRPGPIVNPGPIVMDPSPPPAPAYRTECTTVSFFVKPKNNNACATIAGISGAWSGSSMWPGTSSPFCRYQWVAQNGAAVDFNAIEAIADVIPGFGAMPARPDIRPECTPATCGVGGACTTATHAEDPTPDGGEIIPNGVPLCPSCGWVFGDQMYVVLDPSLVNIPALGLVPNYTAQTFAPPAGQQTFTVQLVAPLPANGSVVGLWAPH